MSDQDGKRLRCFTGIRHDGSRYVACPTDNRLRQDNKAPADDARLPSLPQPVVDAAAGFGDGVSLGATRALRKAAGWDGENPRSSTYETAEELGNDHTQAIFSLIGASALARTHSLFRGGTRATGDPQPPKGGKAESTPTEKFLGKVMQKSKNRILRVGSSRMRGTPNSDRWIQDENNKAPRIAIGPDGVKHPHFDLRFWPVDKNTNLKGSGATPKKTGNQSRTTTKGKR